MYVWGGVSFLTFLENPQKYIDDRFSFVDDPDENYPVAYKDELKIYFVHYKTADEAISKWAERSKRIMWDHIYVIATGHGGLECEELMERFDKLNYKNKVMFTSKPWPQYRWAKQVKCLKEVEHMPPLSEFATLTGKRYYETAFNLPEWISKCENEVISN